jgi:hypothetical protein
MKCMTWKCMASSVEPNIRIRPRGVIVTYAFPYPNPHMSYYYSSVLSTNPKTSRRWKGTLNTLPSSEKEWFHWHRVEIVHGCQI